MNTNSTFTAEGLTRLREEITDAWSSQIPRDTEEGWSVSPVDFAEVIAVCSPLKFKQGWTLQAYQFRSGNNGKGLVLAVPSGQTLPEPLDPDDNTPPPAPAFALSDFREILESDGSANSYVYASIFSRELNNFGSFRQGDEWLAHNIIDADPWKHPFEVTMGSDMSRDESEWTLLEPKPLDWQPVVQVKPEEVTVTFYTFCGLGMQKITRFTDTYTVGSYIPQSQNKIIARGPKGYVW